MVEKKLLEIGHTTSSSSIFDHLKSNFYYSVQSAMRILTRYCVESEQVACDVNKTVLLNPELGGSVRADCNKST